MISFFLIFAAARVRCWGVDDRPMVAILARYASRFSVRALDLTVIVGPLASDKHDTIGSWAFVEDTKEAVTTSKVCVRNWRVLFTSTTRPAFR
jgi:hypothetical protein